ncbi:MAG: hypothetical protein EP344_19310, partial [Bacteroidetes bacterium]
VTLNLLLIPHYQAFGAAVAALCTQTFIAVAMAGLCLRYYDLRPSVRGLAGLLGFAALQLLAAWMIFRQSGLPWIAGTGLFLLQGLVSAVLFRLLDFRILKVLAAR